MIVIVSEVAFSFSWLKAATTTFTFKTLLGAFSVIVKTGCETDGSFYSTSDNSCSGMSADLFGYRAVQSGAGVAGRHSSLQTSAVSPPCLKRLQIL